MRSLILGFFVLFLVSSTESEKHFSITVKIDNIKSVKGIMEVALYKDPSKFPKVGQTHRMARVKVEGKEVTYTFEHLEEDDYAICIYHDVNSNKICDKNFFGIPTEAYAFSNNIRPKLSVPSFEECSTHLDKNKTFVIKMVY
jgi:uncharacterized protein (DUF2141 family)